jgi:hypothetical protein
MFSNLTYFSIILSVITVILKNNYNYQAQTYQAPGYWLKLEVLDPDTEYRSRSGKMVGYSQIQNLNKLHYVSLLMITFEKD